MKFRQSFVDQASILTYKLTKVIAEFSKPSRKNEYLIKDTQMFPDILQVLLPLRSGEEYVSYDVNSLLMDIHFVRNQRSYYHILNEIYAKKNVKQTCIRLKI